MSLLPDELALKDLLAAERAADTKFSATRVRTEVMIGRLDAERETHEATKTAMRAKAMEAAARVLSAVTHISLDVARKRVDSLASGGESTTYAADGATEVLRAFGILDEKGTP